MAAAGNNNIFVYLGGNQEVPFRVSHAVIDPSVNIVSREAFRRRQLLQSVIFHGGVEIIEADAFYRCLCFRGGIKLLGVREIRDRAFFNCQVTDVEFGDRLETIGHSAFHFCKSLRSIKSLSVRSIQPQAFSDCEQLTEAEFGSDLEIIGCHSFHYCPNLQRIAIPLKDNLFPIDPVENRYTQFRNCDNLTTVDIVGTEGVHNTISSFLIESWKDEINEEIHRINRELPNTFSTAKTNVIQLWVRSVINMLDHYKAEHNRLLNEHMTLLELAVWKAKLDEKEEDSTQRVQRKRAKIEKSTREEKRITSGADTIIKNVLPFLKLQ